MNFEEMTDKNFILFDGAMGTMLQNAGLKAGELPEAYNMLHPEIIKDIHSKYIKAGADVITTNTFGANELKFDGRIYCVEEIISKAVHIAKEAAGFKLVALDIGPTGKLMEPFGELSFDRAYDIFKRQIIAGAKAGADLILIETIADLYEARAAILAAKENCSLPVFCTMTFQQNGRTLMGTDPLTMVNVLEGLGVDALGVNCSLGPKDIYPILEEILRYSSIPVMVQPNAGLPRISGDEIIYDIKAKEFAGYIGKMAGKGALIFGGCCGTNPEYIQAAREVLKSLSPVKLQNKRITAVSSSTKTVILGDEVRVIGERINPTGKKRFKEALINNDMDYILSSAISQREAGADILDVNVGLPEIDEIEIMARVVEEIQSTVKLPLVIDSGRRDVLEKAVRIYNGKPIVNSVSGDASAMEEILPVVKKYGACVIGLTLDENGIPSTAQKRVEIAGKIIENAKSYGIPKENIIIDCLVLTASAQQEDVMEAIKAVRMVKDKYDVKTALGISNVSFGLPGREALNRTYLAAALAHGLDAPIVNPMGEGIMETINAFKVLSNHDKDAASYIKSYGNRDLKSNALATGMMRDLKQIIIAGIRNEAEPVTRSLLIEMEPLKIVSDYLIPALDIVGQRYEKGDIFLPELIRSAETVKNAFDVIRETMIERGENKISKGKILLATVKGDVHDIGKNIVKVLLENYGFEVIDLGKDVPADSIVKKVKEENIKLVGLSALMTTTVKSMELTIKSLKESGAECTVMVGGAVLNSDYASLIGADYYSADAREAVRIAMEVYSQKL